MELRQLRYFLSAATHLSFTDAAKECCIVQSAMSQQVRALEKELDVTLFERTKQGLRLTREGEVLQREAQRLLDQVTLMQSAVQQSHADGLCLLRVGCQHGLMWDALPHALATLKGERANIDVLVRYDLRKTLLSALREGKLDCAVILRDGADLEGLTCQTLLEETAQVMLPASSSDLSEKPLSLILCESEIDSPLLSARLCEYFPESRRTLVDSQSAVEAMVAAGCGISVCPGSAARPHPGIVYRPMPSLPGVSTALVWMADGPQAALAEALSSILMMDTSK